MKVYYLQAAKIVLSKFENVHKQHIDNKKHTDRISLQFAIACPTSSARG